MRTHLDSTHERPGLVYGLRSRLRRGFTLVENTLALALVASTVLPVVGLIGVGLSDAKQAGDHRITANLRNTVHQLLLDPAWPSEAKPAADWSAERYFDHAGRLIPASEKAAAAMILHLRKVQAPGYQSDWLETVEATFQIPDQAGTVARTLVQRRKTSVDG